jgi:tetratricopeptide (TPR) repeat protein
MLHDREYGQAIELLEKVVEQSPGVTAPYINMAIAYKHLGNLDQAEEHLKTALAMVPGHPVAMPTNTDCYIRKAGRFERRGRFTKPGALEFSGLLSGAQKPGILCDLYLNDLASALDHYELYSQARPEDAQVKAWIADLRNRLGTQLEGRDGARPARSEGRKRRCIANWSLCLGVILLPAVMAMAQDAERKMNRKPRSSPVCPSSATMRRRNRFTSFPGKARKSVWRPACT